MAILLLATSFNTAIFSKLNRFKLQKLDMTETSEPSTSLSSTISTQETEYHERSLIISEFLKEHNIVPNKKKLKQYVMMSPKAFEAVKLQTIVATCCKVVL